MKKAQQNIIFCIFFATVVLYLFFNSHVAANDSCMDRAKTQLDLTECAANEFKKTDGELNRLYQSILADYAENKLFLEKLKTSQRAWIKFRDAEMDVLFPINPEDESKFNVYGKIYSMCYYSYMSEMTRERIYQLKKRFEKKDDSSDVCGGTMK